jgi:ankyrin repeat protein
MFHFNDQRLPINQEVMRVNEEVMFLFSPYITPEVRMRNIQALLDRGFDPNSPLDAQGQTLLHRAVAAITHWNLPDSDWNLVDMLVARGGNLYARDTLNQIPLHGVPGNRQSALAALQAARSQAPVPQQPLQTTQPAAMVSQPQPHPQANPNPEQVKAIANAIHSAMASRRFAEQLPGVQAVLNQHRGSPVLNAALNPNFGSTVLQRAASIGRLDIVQALLEAGANPNVRDNFGVSPLHYAAALGDNRAWWVSAKPHYYAPVVRALLDAGANPNVQDNQNRTPLHRAYELGDQNVVNILLNSGADPNMRDQQDRTPHQCASQQSLQQMQQVNSRTVADALQEAMSQRGFANKFTAVQGVLSQHYGSPDLRTALNLQNRFGQTLLHYAARKGRGDIVQALLDAGANPDVQDNEGWTPLQYAQNNGVDARGNRVRTTAQPNHYVAVAQILSHALQQQQSQAPQQPMMFSSPRPAAMSSPNPHANGAPQPSAVAQAIDNAMKTRGFNNKLPAVQAVLAQLDPALVRAACTLQNEWGTVLHYAARKGRSDIVQSLLGAGANPNVQDNEGWTPLHYAANHGMNNHGVDINRGRRPAQPQHYTEVVRVLLQHGADPTVHNAQGQTPLNYAMQQRNAHVVEALGGQTRQRGHRS